MNEKEKDRYIDKFKKQGIKDYNLKILDKGGKEFMRERNLKKRTYLMTPIVEVAKTKQLDQFNDDFKALLTTLQLDEIGNYVKTDKVILMIRLRTFAASKRKKR